MLALSILSVFAVSCSTSTPLMNHRAAPLETSKEWNLELGMHNESPIGAPMDFKVFIGGHPAFSGEIDFDPHGQKTLRFKVAKGTHAVYVRSDKANCWSAQSVKVAQKVWVYIAYWHFPGTSDNEGPPPIDPCFSIRSRLEEALIY